MGRKNRDEYDQIATATVDFVRQHWESQRTEMIYWLMEPRHGNSGSTAFSRRGAVLAVNNFIESMIYVAEGRAKAAASRCRSNVS